MTSPPPSPPPPPPSFSLGRLDTQITQVYRAIQRRFRQESHTTLHITHDSVRR